MQLKQISKLFVQISPMSGYAKSAREFLSRATSRKALETNPQCEIVHNIRHKGENFVEVTFASQAVERIYTKDLTAEDILERINAVAEQMDMEERLKTAGLHGQKLVSTWQAGSGKEADMGTVSFEPRQA